MLIDHGHRIFDDLLGSLIAVSASITVRASISMVLYLREVMAQLVEKALAQIAAANSWRIELTNNLDRLMQILSGESGGPGGREPNLRPQGGGGFFPCFENFGLWAKLCAENNVFPTILTLL